ncbi:hypothetical protein [Sphingobacterium sp. SGR-19]|uniref:hypothetical protein n=1 Tax=Sphingobacterium sp. SGR-19 TaxID=2710886 RepID=UPI0013EC3617|nr:hypothetical protein [Sphingobacterium sp. SGR-19]NGM64096.1 hypothetical protein [Sphingobacterium sp. SGR-19]
MKLFTRISIFTASIVVAVACKKEEALLPYNDIVNFTVAVDESAMIKAAIDGDSIVLYWPIGQTIPETLTPTIHVADGASISPASGETIALRGEVTYTVTAETGDTKTYRLRIPNNRPRPYINSFGGLQTYQDKQYIFQNFALSIRGDYFDTLADGAKVYFVDIAGNDHEVEIQHSTELGYNVLASVLGTFSGLKIFSSGYTIFYETTPFEVAENPFVIIETPKSTLSVKTGGTITLTGVNTDNVEKMELGNYFSNSYKAVTIVNKTESSITFRVPEDFPPGEYNELVVHYPAGPYHDAGQASTYMETSNSIVITQ